mgnify:FL=1
MYRIMVPVKAFGVYVHHIRWGCCCKNKNKAVDLCKTKSKGSYVIDDHNLIVWHRGVEDAEKQVV